MNRLCLVATIGLLSSACTVERFRIANRTCGDNFTKWSGGLTYHLLQGEQMQGTWSYDPAGDAIESNTGVYDFATGDFVWDLDYASSSWADDGDVEGYGYANSNGDLDIQYTYAITDNDEFERAVSIREERVGCDTTWRITDNRGQNTFLYGEYDNGVFTYDLDVGDNDLDIEGTWRDDGTWTHTVDTARGLEAVTEGALDGSSVTTWETDSTAGESTTSPDGDIEIDCDEGGENWDLPYSPDDCHVMSMATLHCYSPVTICD